MQRSFDTCDFFDSVRFLDFGHISKLDLKVKMMSYSLTPNVIFVRLVETNRMSRLRRKYEVGNWVRFVPEGSPHSHCPHSKGKP